MLGRPWCFQEIAAPRFHDSRPMKVVRLSAVRTGHIYPPANVPGTQFCERLSPSGPYWSQKDFVNENFQWHCQESNPQPSSVYCSALTDCATVCLQFIPHTALNFLEIPQNFVKHHSCGCIVTFGLFPCAIVCTVCEHSISLLESLLTIPPLQT